MSIIVPEKEEMHSVEVKFTHASLPEARKPFHLRTANQTELDLRQAAIKAKVYRLGMDTEVIINGFTAMMEALCYLAADGYRIRTNYFSISLKVPGEYEGNETSLPQDVSPIIRIQPSRSLKEYIKGMVAILIDGKRDQEGRISIATDDASGALNERVTIGSIMTICGLGIKILADGDNKREAGVFFLPVDGGEAIKCKLITVNEPKTLKVLVPSTLEEGKEYRLLINTWSPFSHGSGALKRMRSIQSDFSLLAQIPSE